MMAKIYVVDDEKNLNLLLAEYLRREGHAVESFFDGLSALAHVADKPDVWVLDIMLGDVDGYTLLKRIKETNDCPVIFISAKNDLLDRVVGLELGSDDYLPKPFLPRELVIRVQRILQKKQAPPKDETLYLADYHIDTLGRMVEDAGTSIALTHKEWQLLLYLADNLGRVVSREQILRQVWGEDYYGSDRVVDDTVRRLRKKLPRLPLETVYQLGYKLVRA